MKRKKNVSTMKKNTYTHFSTALEFT